jgi:hypothetical protein
VILLSDEQEIYDFLLSEYRSIWNNRQLALVEGSSQKTLMDAIKRDLLDENSHPRIRKNKYQKYYMASKRVLNSSLSTEIKLQLMELHNQIMEEIG